MYNVNTYSFTYSRTVTNDKAHSQTQHNLFLTNMSRNVQQSYMYKQCWLTSLWLYLQTKETWYLTPVIWAESSAVCHWTCVCVCVCVCVCWLLY